MLANITCWVIATALIFAKTSGIDLYIRLLFAMGFIFLGTLSKAVDTYRETHVGKGDEKKTSVDAR